MKMLRQEDQRSRKEKIRGTRLWSVQTEKIIENERWRGNEERSSCTKRGMGWR